MTRLRRIASLRVQTLVGALTALFVVSAARSAAAHDFFLIPQSHFSEQSTIDLDATISAAFPTLELTVAADRIADVQVLSSSRAARAEVVGAGEKSLRLRLRDAGKGLSVVAVQTVPREVDYAEDRIDGIMSEYEVSQDAIDAVGSLPRPRTLRAISTRLAKTHVCVIDCNDRTAAARAVGVGLEFVAASPRDDASYRLLLNGGPMPNHPIVLAKADGARRRGSTDDAGQVALTEADRGILMLFAANMRPPSSSSDRFELQLTSLTVERR